MGGKWTGCLRSRERRWRLSLRTMTVAILLTREAEAIAILRNLPPRKLALGQVGDRDYDVFLCKKHKCIILSPIFLGQ